MKLLVLREGVHGLSPSAYAETLRDRLDGHTVRHASTPVEEREAIESADIATGVSIGPSLLERATKLRLFACAYAGTGHLPLDSFATHDIAVTNAAGVHSASASEHVIGSILSFSRRLHDAARADNWEVPSPYELAGSTVTIVGLGAIGTSVADRLEPFGVETIGVRRSPDSGGPTDEIIGPDRLHQALARSDFVVLCCPLTDETRGLIGTEEIATLSAEAVLVNVARGEVIDTDALVYALQRGRLGGAALDVTDPEPLPDDHPLWDLDDVLITPHTAGATPTYYDRLADIVVDNVERIEAGHPLRNRVRIETG
jgi:phosphoglycerate dehydrogenase-like enzyme